MDNTTVDKPELEIKNQASPDLAQSEQVIVKPEQTIPLAPDLTSPEVFSVTEKEPQAQSVEATESSQVATPVGVEATEQAVGQVAPVVESEPKTMDSLPVEKQLSEILENKDFSKESPHDALEQILNSSQSGS